jgi:hypothetical protein
VDSGLIVVLAVLAAVLGGGIAVLLMLRRGRVRSRIDDPTVSEFAALPEAERCDVVFAAAALEDEDSAGLLRSALDDPSEAVALAAARGLLNRGLAPTVDEYLQRHPGDRTRRLSQTLALISQR